MILRMVLAVVADGREFDAAGQVEAYLKGLAEKDGLLKVNDIDTEVVDEGDEPAARPGGRARRRRTSASG